MKDMSMEFWGIFLLVMAGTAVADVFWTLYFIEVGKKRPGWSALWSALIIVLGAINVVSYAQSRWYILASVIGAFIGTYLTVKYKK